MYNMYTIIFVKEQTVGKTYQAQSTHGSLTKPT